MARVAVALLVLLAAGTARAHGGLPISQRILTRGGQPPLYVPVEYWGVWLSTGDGAPWTWICEEEINTYRTRRIALSADGAFYTTDFKGLTRSTDGGCTWVSLASSEPLATLHVADVAVDPVDGATVYAAAADGGVTADGGVVSSNGLFVSHDHGAHFTRLGSPSDQSRLYQSVRAAPSDARTLYVTSTARNPPFAPIVHASADGGTSFVDHAVDYTIDGSTPPSLELLAIDPRDPAVLYVRAAIELISDAGDAVAQHALLRSTDGGAHFVEIWRMAGVTSPAGDSRGIDGVAVDVSRGRLLVATSSGLLRSADPGGAPISLAPVGGLSQTQCVATIGGAIYACASDFAPDSAAVARSDDGADTFQAILRFADTRGPVTCPAGTPVGDRCPLFWQMYASQLGVGLPDGGTVIPPAPRGGCHCSFAGDGRPPALLVLVLLIAVSAVRCGGSARRRGSRGSDPCAAPRR